MPEFFVGDGTINFWPYDIIKNLIRSSEAVLLVTDEAAQIHGFVIATNNKAFKKVIIENIYVMPNARNSEIGEQLLSRLLFLVKEDEYEYVSTLIP